MVPEFSFMQLITCHLSYREKQQTTLENASCPSCQIWHEVRRTFQNQLRVQSFAKMVPSQMLSAISHS